jgi:hypothetical protein
MRIFSIGCRDSGNLLEPIVIISKRIKKFSWPNQFYAVDVEMLMVRWNNGCVEEFFNTWCSTWSVASHYPSKKSNSVYYPSLSISKVITIGCITLLESLHPLEKDRVSSRFLDTP